MRYYYMATFLIILSCLLWAAAIWMLVRRPLLGPALSYLGLLTISFAQNNGEPIIPVNNTIQIAWLSMTVVVMLATMLQPEPVRNSSRGMGYMIVGGLAGLTVGLLGFTFAVQIALLYGIMIVAVIAGIFFGFLLYTRTPDGLPLGANIRGAGRYLLAKGFPTAITLMQPGVALVITLAFYNR